MKALTLWRPWAHAVAHLGKRVENREWPLPAAARGQTIAIHAGKRWDGRSAEYLRSRFPSMPATDAGHPLGVVAVARVYNCLDVRGIEREAPDQTPWAFGPYCWLLDEVVALPGPVACSGAQGLWTLLDETERKVSEALASLSKGVARG